MGTIPIVGYLVAYGILNDLNSELEAGLSVEDMCLILQEPALQGVSIPTEFRAACDEVSNIILLRDASVWTGIISVSLIVLYWAATLISGTNRTLNSFIFPKLIPISQVVLAGLVIAEGVIFTYGAYIGEAYLIERVHFVLIGGIGLGALIAAGTLISSIFSYTKSISQEVLGKQISRSDEPEIWKLVDQIAENLDSKIPDHIVVGLEPTFYATAAPIHLLNEGREINGETLYLSLPLMRIFNVAELRAVMGHELGHFSGTDTAYSLKFVPVYAGLSRSIETLAVENESLSSIANLPAIAMLSLMLELFARNERAISQQREFLADKAGVCASSAEALSVALAKMVIYAPIWSKILEDNVDRLNAGKISGNLSLIYEDSAKYDVSHMEISTIMEGILAARTTHPTDTHPTIFERLGNIGFDAEEFTTEMLVIKGNSSIKLLKNFGNFEEELTLFHHRLMAALGLLKLPDEKDGEEKSPLLNSIYVLAAVMISADGNIDQTQVTIAEEIGKEMFADFDSMEFRTCCTEAQNLPAFNEIAAILDKILSSEDESSIYEFLKKLAAADGNIEEEEQEFLKNLSDEWILDD
jgi:Zn-dependent protease with chaperone function/uncharacterized tellurite resistance protein B-like protein